MRAAIRSRSFATPAAGIHVDVMSGSSTGAFIGVFYSAFGDEGLELMIAKRHHFGFAVAAAWYHNGPFELLLTYLLEGLDLNELEIPVIAVAARAADGETAYLSSSLAGRVTFIPETGKFELGSSTRIALEGQPRAGHGGISPHSQPIVEQVSLFIARHAELALRVELHVPADEPDEAVARWEAMIDGALDAAGCSRQSIEREVVRSSSISRVHFELGVVADVA